jgi:hypothetical protein
MWRFSFFRQALIRPVTTTSTAWLVSSRWYVLYETQRLELGAVRGLLNESRHLLNPRRARRRLFFTV